jgi:hypothetical protein
MTLPHFVVEDRPVSEPFPVTKAMGERRLVKTQAECERLQREIVVLEAQIAERQAQLDAALAEQAEGVRA